MAGRTERQVPTIRCQVLESCGWGNSLYYVYNTKGSGSAGLPCAQKWRRIRAARCAGGKFRYPEVKA
jgi:hypothetical protein